MNKKIYKVKAFVDKSFLNIEKEINEFSDKKDIEVINVSVSFDDTNHGHYAMVTYKLSYDCKCADNK
jgi:hypothetical protein